MITVVITVPHDGIHEVHLTGLNARKIRHLLAQQQHMKQLAAARPRSSPTEQSLN